MADSSSFPPWVHLYNVTKSVSFEPIESVPETVKKSYCRRCFEFLSSSPDSGTSVYTISTSLRDSQVEICMLCNIFLRVCYFDSGSAYFLHEMERSRTFKVAYVPKNGNDSVFDVKAIRVSEIPDRFLPSNEYTIQVHAKPGGLRRDLPSQFHSTAIDDCR